MSNNLLVDFSIKDLENLSGIKAHTIRIWEKRYNLLEPRRSETNIRTYGADSLKKLLNISFLSGKGLKISKLAKLSELEVAQLVVKHMDDDESVEHVLNSFKLAMVQFDKNLFQKTLSGLLKEASFDEVFTTVILKLLEQIGLLWQTETISIVHEHFISNLIKQQILLQTAHLEPVPGNAEQSYVLFLPEEEIHDLGLLFINYYLSAKGKFTIYLGDSVPIGDLETIQKLFTNIQFVSYFTVSPQLEKLDTYLDKIQETVLREGMDVLHVLGRNVMDYKVTKDTVKKYGSLLEFIQEMD